MTTNLQEDLHGKLALITGCTGGIGAATARSLALIGCNIAVHYNAAVEKANTLVAELTDAGVKAHAFQADLSSYDEARRFHKEVTDTMGDPVILFNNSGITLKSDVKDITEVSVDDFEKTWRTNCGTAYLLTQLCIPAMQRMQVGRVIFCSSVAGLSGGIIGPHYASSKSALHGLVHWLANTYAKQGITVNAIAPALITETTMLPGTPEALAAKIPVGRLGKPQEIAETVLWMVKTGYVTNKVIAVDGGLFVQ